MEAGWDQTPWFGLERSVDRYGTWFSWSQMCIRDRSKTMELKKPVRVSLSRQVLTAMESMIRSGKWKVGDLSLIHI